MTEVSPPAEDRFRCICPTPSRAVRGCPAHTARYAAQQAGPDPDPVDPVPLPLLHYMSQDVTCCARPMRYLRSHNSWDGQYGSGAENITSTRTCTNCQATLTITTKTPS